MTPVSGEEVERPVRVVSLIEVFDIFAAYMRRGVADLIERGDFAQPYQEPAEWITVAMCIRPPDTTGDRGSIRSASPPQRAADPWTGSWRV
jgi:hypothetical protein